MCIINRQVLKNKAYTPTKKNGYTIPNKPTDERQLYVKGWCVGGVMSVEIKTLINGE